MLSVESHLAEIDKRIQFVLEHPGMSDWIKQILLSGLERDPIDVLNDLDVLNFTLRARCNSLLAVQDTKIPPL